MSGRLEGVGHRYLWGGGVYANKSNCCNKIKINFNMIVYKNNFEMRPLLTL